MSHPVADAIRSSLAAIPDPHRVGVVDGTSPLTVTVGGEIGIAVSRAASYTTPAIGDIVKVLVTETDWIAEYKIVPG